MCVSTCGTVKDLHSDANGRPLCPSAPYYILLFLSTDPDGHRVASNPSAQGTTYMPVYMPVHLIVPIHAHTYTSLRLRHCMCVCVTDLTMLKTMYVLCIPLQDRVDAPACCLLHFICIRRVVWS